MVALNSKTKKILQNFKVSKARLNRIRAKDPLWINQRRSRAGIFTWLFSDCTQRFPSMTASRASQRFSMMCSFTRGRAVCTNTVWQKLWWQKCFRRTTRRSPLKMRHTRYLLASTSWVVALKVLTMRPCPPFILFWIWLSDRSNAAIWHLELRLTCTSAVVRLSFSHKISNLTRGWLSHRMATNSSFPMLCWKYIRFQSCFTGVQKSRKVWKRAPLSCWYSKSRLVSGHMPRPRLSFRGSRDKTTSKKWVKSVT